MSSILADVVAGKPDAVAACMQKYTPPIWNLARQLLRNAHDSEDALQDIFLDVWRSAARFDPNAGSELTFVLTIARRRLIDRARRNSRGAPVASGELIEVTAAEPVADQVEVADESEQVAAAMGELRPEPRTVLERAYLEGQTHLQIAAATGMALGTVKSHARRGLMRLRETLGLPPLPADQNRRA